jgi:hypothetical protein
MPAAYSCRDLRAEEGQVCGRKHRTFDVRYRSHDGVIGQRVVVGKPIADDIEWAKWQLRADCVEKVGSCDA